MIGCNLAQKMEFSKTSVLEFVEKFIDKKYFTTKITSKYYDNYGSGERNTTKEECVDHISDINGQVLVELVNTLPQDVLALADITQELESFKNLKYSSHTPGFGGIHSTNSYKYFTTQDDLGTLTLYRCTDSYDEFGMVDDENTIEIEIANVIYKNYKYYYLTKKLYTWLNEEKKPKRSAYLRKLTYDY